MASSRSLTIYYYPITEKTTTDVILDYVEKYGIDVVLHQDFVIDHDKHKNVNKPVPYVQVGKYHQNLDLEVYRDLIKATNDRTMEERLVQQLFDWNVNIVSMTDMTMEHLERPSDFDWENVGVKRKFEMDYREYENRLLAGYIAYTTKHRGIKLMVCLHMEQLRRIYHPKYGGASPIISKILYKPKQDIYFLEANDVLAYNEEVYKDAIRWGRRFKRYYAHKYCYIRRSRAVLEEFLAERRKEHLQQGIEVDVDGIEEEEDGLI